MLQVHLQLESTKFWIIAKFTLCTRYGDCHDTGKQSSQRTFRSSSRVSNKGISRSMYDTLIVMKSVLYIPQSKVIHLRHNASAE